MIEDLRRLPVPPIDVWADANWRDFYAKMRAYPEQPTEEERAALVNYVKSHEHLMPCHRCRGHLAQHFPGLDAASRSQVDFALWLFAVHNDVNARTGKHVHTWDQSIEAVKRMMRGQGRYGSGRVGDGSGSGSGSGGGGGGGAGAMPVWSIVLVCLLAMAVGVGIGIATARAAKRVKK